MSRLLDIVQRYQENLDNSLVNKPNDFFEPLDNAKEHADDVAAAEDFNARWAEHKNEFARQEIAQDQAAEEAKMAAEAVNVAASWATEHGVNLTVGGPGTGMPLKTVEALAQPGQIVNAKEALRFVMAGNAYFTVRSLKTGVRYTYRVAKPVKNTAYSGERWFVSLLTGPENSHDYSYLGMIQRNLFKLTKASRMKADSVPVKAFSWVFSYLVRGVFPPDTEVWHEGRCGRCGRKLTVPESIAAGIGPECEKVYGKV